MNIFGLIAVIVACITACIITMIVCKLGITMTRQYRDLTNPAPEEHPAMGFVNDNKSNTELEKKLNEDQVAKASMDAVIRAANELMGIEIEEDKKNERK